MFMRYLLSFLLLFGVAVAQPRYVFDSSAQMAQFSRLMHIFRCMVCQNEDLAGSNANLATKLKHEIAQQIRAGESDRQIKNYMVARYGDFVLFDPPWRPSTWGLWFGPLLVLGIALGCFLWRTYGRKRRGK